MHEKELESRLASGKELVVKFIQEHLLDQSSHRFERANDRYLSRKVPVQMLRDLNSGQKRKYIKLHS